ncbi:CDK-activating kinase assembly factor MAT1-like [Dreissena polymorpha]|uniref:CDK-activating kinase assembly factor MAT1 n=1 Tax=Dreissena polymorpha TaxID=45954 RepID=A0A9D4L9L3_DREPO|nr:CDK-activating kinase assembly factor MAT1-like [Dreissena polymorpha]KAH3853824.1 hypothetical protein DPMN_096359 [Dreissena polymorpha]
MDEQGCPRCLTTKYRNPSLKLLVNVCGHSLCESCVDLLFIKGSGNCPECDTALRRNNFRLQLFEDAYIEKEVDIRKKVIKDCYRKEEDFTTLREYNDYLESIETFVYNLTNNQDVENTKRLIEQYKRENKETFQKNRSKLSKDEEYLAMLIEEEEREAQLRREQDRVRDMNEKNSRKKHKEELIDELMFSERPASAILALHNAANTTDHSSAKGKQPFPKFSSGASWGFPTTDGTALPTLTDQGEPYIYTPCELQMLGPDPPSESDVQKKGFLKNVRSASDAERGGGYEARLACQRALMEAMCGLFLYQDTSEPMT